MESKGKTYVNYSPDNKIKNSISDKANYEGIAGENTHAEKKEKIIIWEEPKDGEKLGLVLAGGGSRGAYEAGAWQALTELGFEFDIVFGVSVGAVNGAMAAQNDLFKTIELWRRMRTEMLFEVPPDANTMDFAKRFFTNMGASQNGLQDLLDEFVSEESIRNSSVDFGLLTMEIPAMKGHVMWIEQIPQGRLTEFITASASAFPAIKPKSIDGRNYIDGGYSNNLPTREAFKRGADKVIAINLKGPGRYHSSETEENSRLKIISSSWDLGEFLVFDPENSRKLLRLGYLETMKAFDIFCGGFYTFTNDSFSVENDLKCADCAAKIFHMDPTVLYRREFFDKTLKRHVHEAIEQMSVDTEKILSGITKLSPMRAINELTKLTHKRTITLLLYDYLRDNGNFDSFVSKRMERLFAKEIEAAKYLFLIDA